MKHNPGFTFDAKITLTNEGTDPISKGDWEIYFYHIRFLAGLRNKPIGIEVGTVRFYHVNGVLYKFTPEEDFEDLTSGKSMEITFEGENWLVTKTDVMPNWYVAASGCESRTIESTSGESLSFIGDFDTAAKWKRYNNDVFDPYDARTRYDLQEVSDAGEAVKPVVPTPVKVELDQSSKVNLGTGDWTIFNDSSLSNEVNFLHGKFSNLWFLVLTCAVLLIKGPII